MLEELGFALDLTCCAVSGSTDDLVYVSPRSGRAVSRAAAGKWADRLLPLPNILLGEGDAETSDILHALGTTGHFLINHLARSLGELSFPEARQRLIDALRRHA